MNFDKLFTNPFSYNSEKIYTFIVICIVILMHIHRTRTELIKRADEARTINNPLNTKQKFVNFLEYTYFSTDFIFAISGTIAAFIRFHTESVGIIFAVSLLLLFVSVFADTKPNLAPFWRLLIHLSIFVFCCSQVNQSINKNIIQQRQIEKRRINNINWIKQVYEKKITKINSTYEKKITEINSTYEKKIIEINSTYEKKLEEIKLNARKEVIDEARQLKSKSYKTDICFRIIVEYTDRSIASNVVNIEWNNKKLAKVYYIFAISESLAFESAEEKFNKARNKIVHDKDANGLDLINDVKPDNFGSRIEPKLSLCSNAN